VAQLDDQIDQLYQLRPDEFTPARAALAKSLTREQARDVSRLKKPTTIPWAVNQVYWQARDLYRRLVQRGEALRTAQIATLKGRKADVAAAAAAHRDAVTGAVHRAVQLAAASGTKANPEELARMFEALSLAPTPPAERPGRFTKVLAPAGFEALAGVTPTIRPPEAAGPPRPATPGAKVEPSPVDRAEARRRERDARERRRQAETALSTATQNLAGARRLEEAARQTLSRAQAEVRAAEQAVADAKAQLTELSSRPRPDPVDNHPRLSRPRMG